MKLHVVLKYIQTVTHQSIYYYKKTSIDAFLSSQHPAFPNLVK